MIPGMVPIGYAGPATPMTIWTTQRTGERNTTCRNTTSFPGRDGPGSSAHGSRPPTGRRVAATPTARQGGQRDEALGRLPHHCQRRGCGTPGPLRSVTWTRMTSSAVAGQGARDR